MPVLGPIRGCISMLLIPCPHCGERDESEFDYGGRAIDFPDLNADQAKWHKKLHLHEASEFLIDEVWFHSAGCECWIQLRRDTLTHKFCSINDADGDCC